jgi:hypothetical protein
MNWPDNEAIEQAQRRLLWVELIAAFGNVQGLQNWLNAHLPAALPDLVPGTLDVVLRVLLQTAEARDGAMALYQELVNYPPSTNVPGMIHTITGGAITPRQASDGLPVVPSHLRWFVFRRPFVDRTHLRSQLQELAHSDGGPDSILVIEGERRTGKSLAVSLALGVKEESRNRRRIDIDGFGNSDEKININARDLAVAIAGTEEGCPKFDITKEAEAVFTLNQWLKEVLNKETFDEKTRVQTDRWILIDHCDRKFMTRPARNLLKKFAEELQAGAMQGVRLILADFSLNELPEAWRSQVRHDQALLPTQGQVEEWSRDLATKAHKVFDQDAPAEWASSVFKDLDRYNKDDGSWHMAFDQRLRRVAETIRACEVQP